MYEGLLKFLICTQLELTFRKQIQGKYLNGIIDVEMMKKTISKIAVALFITLVCNDFFDRIEKIIEVEGRDGKAK